MKKANRLFHGGAALFQRVFTRLGCQGRPPRFHVEVYPYTNLVLTIRRREEAVYVRFSDLMRQCSLPVLEGAAALLLSRIYRRRTPKSLAQPYREYARSQPTPQRIQSMRRTRVRPQGPLATRSPRTHPARPLLRSRQNLRFADRELLQGKSTRPASWLDATGLAPRIRLRRPRPKSKPSQPPHGSSRRPAVRCRV